MADQTETWGADRRRAGGLERLLWFCAGANPDLLEHCPSSDRVKYQGLGGVVLATAVLAFGSGAYAFYTVFSPKTDTALEKSTHMPTAALAIAVGLVWAVIILNLDRFIVSSTGKGDGTDAITWGEFGRALPRLAMAVIIGICISAPLEIRVLKPEIDGQLSLEQQEFEKSLNAKAEKAFDAAHSELQRKSELAQKRLDDSAAYFEKRRIEIKEQYANLEREAEGLSASGKAGRGPAWQDKKDTLDELEKERARDLANADKKNSDLHADIEHWKKQNDGLSAELRETRLHSEKQAKTLDGLLKRIQISHRIGGSIPLFIMALLLAIECGPIFFKLMLTKGTYDYLEENEKHLRQARMGVMVDGVIRADKDGQEVRMDRFLRAERLLAEEQLRLETEHQLSAQVHAQFRIKTSAEIEADPSRFLAPQRKDEKPGS